MSPRRLAYSIAIAIVGIVAAPTLAHAGEPPAINPFGKTSAAEEREDAVPGRLELSNGSVRTGLIYLTRDKRLQIYDEALQRQREIPLQAIKQIDCSIKREWLEREWKFKETTSDEKMYTGRHYPSREYIHTITLKSGKTITGGLSAIVYVQPQAPDAASGSEPSDGEPERFLLNKRNKGEIGQTMKALVYVKRIKLGKAAMEEEKDRGPAKRKTSKAEE
jgi:hypothetical protein